MQGSYLVAFGSMHEVFILNNVSSRLTLVLYALMQSIFWDMVLDGFICFLQYYALVLEFDKIKFMINLWIGFEISA